jgi:hypothetical protein|tara:strand:+ start:2706 stop:3020 length:315 start_codon:yes stop_codon:yes gene_type:complete
MSQFKVPTLKKREKPSEQKVAAAVDQVAEESGFVAREPVRGRRGGRPKSPRTEQIHARVLPGYGLFLADVAMEQGLTQGHILEAALKLYAEEHGQDLGRYVGSK